MPRMRYMKAKTQRGSRPSGPSPAARLAREAWLLQYSNAPRSLALAERAFERAVAAGDGAAECRARLARGFHWMRFDTPEKGEQELTQAQQCFEATRDRAGAILAAVGISRCWWRQGRFREALDLVLPLRGEGLRLLKGVDRCMLLNGIAGCYSALGQSGEAFAYMYQALRESSAALMHGFDVVLYTNLSHELLQLGDYAEALRHVEEGIKRCAGLNNPRLLTVLLVNRIVCLTEMGRPRDALPDIRHVLDLPDDAAGRGESAASFETLAIAALRAGELALGAEMVARAAGAAAGSAISDERIEHVVAEAELLRAQGRPAEAAARLESALPLPADLSLRVRCLFHEVFACANEQRGEAALAWAPN